MRERNESEVADVLTPSKIVDHRIKVIDGDRGANYPKAGDLTSTGDCLFLTAKNVAKNGFSFEERKFISFARDAAMGKGRLSRGDIVITTRGTLGNFAWYTDAVPYAHIRVNSGMAIVRNADPQIVSEFLYQFLRSDIISDQVKRLSFGSAQPQLTIGLIERLKLFIPPLLEQRKIAEILRTWDEAIEKLEALRAAKERRLHSLREKLTYVDAEGEPIRLGDVTEEVTTRNGDGRLGREMVMGVTNSRGIVPMREQTIAEDISRYKVVPPQAFAYNPMRINVGSIAMNEAADAILVSPDYVVFACLHDQLSPDFLDHLRSTKWWAHYINSGGSGSVRQRTYYADLAAMKVPLPDFDRQRRIADFLNTARYDVQATTREITALQRQKRGLMQKLLTGEWRVKIGKRIS